MEFSINNYYLQNVAARKGYREMKKNLKSAEGNCGILEKKQRNKLALPTDMIDANNTKIEAEQKVIYAEINVVFTRYQLYKAAGILF